MTLSRRGSIRRQGCSAVETPPIKVSTVFVRASFLLLHHRLPPTHLPQIPLEQEPRSALAKPDPRRRIAIRRSHPRYHACTNDASAKGDQPVSLFVPELEELQPDGLWVEDFVRVATLRASDNRLRRGGFADDPAKEALPSVKSIWESQSSVPSR